MATEIASLFVKIGANIDDLQDGLNRANGMLLAAADAFQQVGGAMTRGITLPLLGIGIAATVAATSLDREMRNIQSISQDTDKSIAGLRDTFIEMSTDITMTTASAQELAAGFYQIQSSGFAGADAMQVLEASAMASTAGMTSVSVAATALTATLNAYGEGAGAAARYTDTMFRAVDIGVMSFEELGSSLSNILPTAAALGVNFETVTAAMSTMTKQGMTAAESSVALNQVLLSLMKPSEAMAAALHNIGYESGQAALNALGLEGVLQSLSDAGYDSATTMSDLFTNVRALRGALSLSGEGLNMFERDLKSMAGAAGATQMAFDQQMKSIENRMKSLKNEATKALLGIFDALEPTFNAIVKGASGMAESFNGLGDSMQSFVVGTAVVLAALGPLLTGIGKLGELKGILAGISALMVDAGGSMAILAGAALPAAVAVTGFALALAGLAYGKDVLDKMDQQGWTDFFDEYSTGAYTAVEATQAYIEEMGNAQSVAMAPGMFARGGADIKAEAAAAELLADNYAAFNDILLKTTSNYSEYSGLMQKAGYSNNIYTQSAYEAARANMTVGQTAVDAAAAILTASKTYDEYSNQLEKAGLAAYDVGAQTFYATNAAIAMDDAIRSTSVALDEFGDLAAEQAEQQDLLKAALDANIISQDLYNKSIDEIAAGTFFLDQVTKNAWESQIKFNDSMTKAESIMAAGGISADEQASFMNYLSEATGSASVEFDRQAATMATLTAAYQAGIISQGLFNEAMAAAVNNTSLLNDEQLAQINNSIASVEAMNLASIAAGKYAQNLYSLAGSFQNATTAIKQGELAMSMLNEAYNNGSITGTQFAEGMQSINDKYGVYSDKALAAAAGTMQLMDAMQAGKIEDFGGAYQKMLENVSENLDPMAGVMEDFGTATEAAIAPLEDMEDVSVTAEFKTNADSVIQQILDANEAMAAAMDTSVTHTINIVTVYSTVGSPAAGSPGTMTGVPTISPPTGTPIGPAPAPGFTSSSQSVAPSTSSTAAPSYVSQDTYNIYNPLAAAIIAEQKHQDRVTAAEEVLR